MPIRPYLGSDAFDPEAIEVMSGAAQARVVLHGAALARAGELGLSVEISMTHSRETAGAVALAH